MIRAFTAFAGDDGIEILMSPAVAALKADIDAGPVRNRNRSRHNGGALRGRSAADAICVSAMVDAAASNAIDKRRIGNPRLIQGKIHTRKRPQGT